MRTSVSRQRQGAGAEPLAGSGSLSRTRPFGGEAARGRAADTGRGVRGLATPKATGPAPLQLWGDGKSDDEDFVFDPEEFEEEQKEDLKYQKKYTMPRSSRRKKFWPGGFVDTKDLSTRRKLMNRQGFTKVGKNRATLVSPMTKKPFTLRKHKGKWVEDRTFSGKVHQPVIDHDIDVLALEDQWDEAELSDMSDAEEDTFKQFVYNDPENLRILPKSEDKSSLNPTYRIDTIPRWKKKAARKLLKKNRRRFKKESLSSYWSRLRDKKRTNKERKIRNRLERQRRDRQKKFSENRKRWRGKY